MRKSQISQVFTYIATMLVIGLLVIIGYKAIDMMMGKQCDAQRAIFEKDLLNFIDEYSDYGSVHEEIIKLPCDTKEICFADATHFAPYCDGFYSDPEIAWFTEDSVITSAVMDCQANIFLKREFTETLNNPVKFSNKIVLNDPQNPEQSFKCFKAANNQLKLVFTGLGSKTLIEQG